MLSPEAVRHVTTPGLGENVAAYVGAALCYGAAKVFAWKLGNLLLPQTGTPGQVNAEVVEFSGHPDAGGQHVAAPILSESSDTAPMPL
jgi:hypothetical protein